MKRLSLFALTFAMPLAVLAQTTVYSDNFSADTSANYLASLSGGTTAWVGGSGMTVNTTGTGKLASLVGSFSTVTLANVGDSISFVVDFNSPVLGQGGASLPGQLLFALDNSLGVSPTSLGTTQSAASAANTGATAGYLGYAGMISMSSTPKTSTKFYAKTGSGNNELAYSSNMGAKLQLSTAQNNANNFNLASSEPYTLTYTIAALTAGATEMQVTATITDHTLNGDVVVDNFTLGATNGATWVTPTASFNVFDFGQYSGNETAGYSPLNVSGIEVIASLVPEPSSALLFLGGIGALALVRRFRR